LEAQAALDDSRGDNAPKRRGTSSRGGHCSSSSPILAREDGSSRKAVTIDEALEEAKHLQKQLQAFQITLKEHLRIFPRARQELLKAEAQHMQHEL
jgi:hypothetical protein